MTVRITSQVLGLAVGASYTGNLESWLLNEGYATTAAAVPDAWTEDSDGILGGAKPTVAVTPTAAVLVGSANAVNLSAGGNLVLGTKGGVRTTVSLTSGDTPAAAATKIDTALGSLGDAAIVSGKLQITSTATGTTAYVSVEDGGVGLLASLKLAVGDVDYGGDGRPTGASNLGPQADVPANDPTLSENRDDAPYWPTTPDLNATIANDATNLTKAKFPAPINFDFDDAGVEEEAPARLSLSPASGEAAGGTIVGLSGDNLDDETTVTVGGAAVSEVYVTAGDKVVRIDFAVPAHAAGAVDVVVTNSVGATTLTGGFTYTA